MSRTDEDRAFPRQPFDVNDYSGDGSPGMTLRQWYAGRSDIPWNAVHESMKANGIGGDPPTIGEVIRYRAALKFAEADAMMEAGR